MRNKFEIVELVVSNYFVSRNCNIIASLVPSSQGDQIDRKPCLGTYDIQFLPDLQTIITTLTII